MITAADPTIRRQVIAAARWLVERDHRVPVRAIADIDQLSFPDTLPEWLSPVAAIIPAQLFSYHLARARGLDPEQPRGLDKVTLTR